jgi:hypothetical protein
MEHLGKFTIIHFAASISIKQPRYLLVPWPHAGDVFGPEYIADEHDETVIWKHPL